MRVLVTGAAGYIGSVVTEILLEKGHQVVALDNLSEGHRAAVTPEAVFFPGDVGDAATLDAVFSRQPIEAVLHLAAASTVGDITRYTSRYFQVNVAGGVALLEAMRRHGVNKLVFSSTAAVYGEPETVPISEDMSERPIHPYGESKLMFERVLRWYGQAYGLQFVCLRYFNAAGATLLHGEDHRPETHLIPLVLEVALGQKESVSILGTDYATPDSTCVRDYIHVADLAQAHILALERLDAVSGRHYNLGNGQGFSVLQVVETTRQVTATPVPTVPRPRRPGDSPALVASARRARAELGWQPAHPALADIVGAAWEWKKRHPNGYQT